MRRMSEIVDRDQAMPDKARKKYQTWVYLHIPAII